MRDDYPVDRFLSAGCLSEIRKIREERELWMKRESIAPFLEAVASVSGIRTEFFDGFGDTVVIGGDDELSREQKAAVLAALKAMIPWRKGPFSVMGTEVDAEWRSYRKWDRLLPEMPDLSDRVIADVGCNNGYYMFRMAAHDPRLVVGFDPVPRFKCAFDLLHGFVPHLPLSFELLGVEHLALFENVFDVVFLMGVLYHHPDPIGMLRGVFASLKPGGELILETQGIPGEGSFALFPEKRYAQVPGTWFVPTLECLVNFIRRSGFRRVKVFDSHPMSPEEQRPTEWMPYHSYEDFLDPDDPLMTVEGYPAPHRFFVKAVRPE